MGRSTTRASKRRAPKIDPNKCGKCKELIEEKPVDNLKQSIECECCTWFFHIGCVDVSVKKYDAIDEYNMHWYCPSCDVAAVKLHQESAAILAEQSKIRADLDSLTTRVNSIETNQSTVKESYKSLNKKVSDLDSKINSFNNDCSDCVKNDSLTNYVQHDNLVSYAKTEDVDEKCRKLQEQINQISTQPQKPDWSAILKEGSQEKESMLPVVKSLCDDEWEEKKRQEMIKLNLVVYGIKEDEEDNDLNTICTLIEDELKIKPQIEKVLRIGKKDDTRSKPRPLKLFMKDMRNRKSILQKATMLRKSADQYIKSNIYIGPDLTFKQQRESKNLRDLLRERREKEPTKTWKITKGEIVEVQNQD